MSYSTEFKRIFAELIEDMDCKKSEIPKKLGIDYNIYVKIKEYGAIPRPVILERIADYFNVSVEYLLGRTDDPYFERSAKKHTFRERYDQLRVAKGMTEYAVAKMLHIGTSYTTSWKKHGYIPSLDYLLTLAEIFGVSLDYLLGRTDYKK